MQLRSPADLAQLPSHITYRGLPYTFKIYADALCDSASIQINDGNQSSMHNVGMDEIFRSRDLPDLVTNLLEEHIFLVESHPNYRHQGPTNSEMNSSPALKAAWEEFCVVKRLCGVK